MKCSSCTLFFTNLFAVLFGLGLLVLGVRSGLHGLTGLACVILAIAFLGCTRNSITLLLYVISMLPLMITSVWFLVDPDTVKPYVADKLEEFLIAILNEWSGKPFCCPTIPLDGAKDATSWIASQVLSVENKALCGVAQLSGIPRCEDVASALIDAYGSGIAIVTTVLAIIVVVAALALAAQNGQRTSTSFAFRYIRFGNRPRGFERLTLRQSAEYGATA